VTSLEPRTPHQPGKLQKLSKNDYVSTLFNFRVNQKRKNVCIDFSIECRRFTGLCSKGGAVLLSQGFVMCANAQFPRMFLSGAVHGYAGTLTMLVKIAGKTALDMAFRRVSRRVR
jgi:hypothetical protein